MPRRWPLLRPRRNGRRRSQSTSCTRCSSASRCRASTSRRSSSWTRSGPARSTSSTSTAATGARAPRRSGSGSRPASTPTCRLPGTTPTPARSSTRATCAGRWTTGSAPTCSSRSIAICGRRAPASSTRRSAGSAGISPVTRSAARASSSARSPGSSGTASSLRHRPLTTSASDRSLSSTKEISLPDRNDFHQEMEHAEMTRKSERGQSMVLTVVFMVVLLGFAALVVDVGSWYRAHRSAQATADASALAGAQVLPDTQTASQLATQFANKNGGNGSGNPQITFSQNGYETDTITVKVTRPTPGFFARVFGSKFMNVTVSGTATARAYNVQGIQNGIAPITVNYKHDLLHCTRGQNPTCNPDFGPQFPTTLTLEDIHQPGGKDAAGAFGLINLNGVGSGNVGAGTLADWLLNGYHDHNLETGNYDSAPGANFNNSQFTSALDQQIGHELLFPVYRLLKGPGSNAVYNIIGWVCFVITSYDSQGSSGTLNGHFTRYTTDGVPVENGNGGGAHGLGVHHIELIN